MKKILIVVIVVIGIIVLFNVENISNILRLNSKEQKDKMYSELIRVPVAATDLEMGKTIINPDIKFIEISESLLEEEVILNIKSILNEKTAKEIKKDEYFYKENFE